MKTFKNMQSSNGLLPLAGHECLTSTNMEDAREFMNDTYCDCDLIPVRYRQKADIKVNYVKLPNISFGYVEYGVETTIIKPNFTPDTYIYLPVGGQGVFTTPQCTNIDFGHSNNGLISDGHPYRLIASKDVKRFLIGIETEALRRYLEKFFHRTISKPLQFNPVMQMNTRSLRLFFNAISSVYNDLTYESSTNLFDNKLSIACVTDHIFGALLSGQEHTYSDMLRQPVSSIAPQQILRAEQYILANLAHSITTENLANAAGVSPRTLFYNFKKFRDTSPSQYIQEQRMKAIRARLVAPRPSDTVTSIAQKWGVTQLGRFAHLYHLKYDELPSHTLRSHRPFRRL